jgi:hypothetical protein
MPYWQHVWHGRPPVKLFSIYRAIPSVFVSAGQLLWKHKAHSPFTDLWVATAIILAVYLGLYALETIRNFVVVSPVVIHSRQCETITLLTRENENLRQRLAVPEVPSQERRRRELVSKEVGALGKTGREILRYIHDQGQVNALALRMESQFDDKAVGDFTAKAMRAGLILYENHVMRIKPELKTALEFVFSSSDSLG